jgi:predicted transposase YbfD/YdcC
VSHHNQRHLKSKEPLVSVSHAVEVRSSDVEVPVVAGVPAAAAASAVRELVLMLGRVADPRDPRGVRHRLATILAVAVFAVLAGAKNYRQVGDRVADLPQPLLALAGARSGAAALGVYQPPSGQTVRRVLSMVDADAADRVVGAWLGSLVATGGQGLLGLAMDGKLVRNAGTAEGEVCLFSAMAHGAAVVVAQLRVPAGTTEVTRARDLLGGLDLAGWVVTGDAAHAQRDTAGYVKLERDADYVLQVKGNQPGLLRQVVAVMPPMLAGTADWVEEESRDGDTIRRSIWIVDAAGVDFPGAVRVFRLLRERFDPFGQRVSKQVVHGVTSLDADRATPGQVAGLVRRHWRLENLVHWPRDVIFGEDHQGAYVGNGPHGMAILRNLVLGLFRLAGVSRVKRLTDSIAADRMRILPVLAAALKR